MSRRRSLSPEVGLYHAIPSAPVASLPVGCEEPEDYEAAAPLNSQLRWIYFILGAAVLLPWNALITATPFFLSRLEGSSYKTSFSSYMSLSFTAANFVFLAHATVTAKESSPSRRIFVGTMVLAALTAILSLSTFVETSPGVFFAFVLLNGIAQAGSGSYLQISVLGVASLFGPLAVQAVMSGQAAVAVVVSVIQIISAAGSVWGTSPADFTAYKVDGNAEGKSAFIFFTLAATFLVFSAATHSWLLRMPAYRAIVPSSGSVEEREALVSSGRIEEKGRILGVAKANLKYEVAVAYVFIVTLAVFPPITTSILPTNPLTHPMLFTSIHFLVFAIGDFAGRSSAAIPVLQVWSSTKLLAMSLARTLFVPLFLMCNLSSTVVTKVPWINSDVGFMVILLAFGASNGLVSSLCMMAAPSLEHNPGLRGRRQDVDVAATVATFCLVGGLAIGSIASFGVRSIICGCNPFIE